MDVKAAGRNVGHNIIAYEFAIGQRVRIDAIETTGIVRRILTTTDGIEYLVAYFDDDKVRREEYMVSTELSRA